MGVGFDWEKERSRGDEKQTKIRLVQGRVVKNRAIKTEGNLVSLVHILD
jgi:hypothetical protein